MVLSATFAENKHQQLFIISKLSPKPLDEPPENSKGFIK